MPSLPKLILLVLLALSVSILPASAGTIETRDGQTVIRVVTAVPDMGGGDPVSRADLAAIRLFQQKFPGIFRQKYAAKYAADPARYGRFDWNNVRVEVVPFSQLEVEGVETDLMSIAGGVAPDILYVNFRKSDNYIQSGFLHPLDQPADGYLTAMSREELDFRVNSKLWEVMKRVGPGGQERVWAMPFGGALGKVLIYRRQLFDEKQLPYPNDNWTWDDLREAAKKLSNPQRGVYGFALGSGKHESWYWLTFLWSAGGEVMLRDPATNAWRCTFDTPEAVTAFDFYTRMTTERWTDDAGVVRRGYAYRDSDITAKWDRGEIAMRFADVDQRLLAANSPSVTGISQVPLGPTGQRHSELNSQMMGLYSGIQSPAVRDAAWEFMRFIGSEEAVAEKTKVMVRWGLGPYLDPKHLERFGFPEVARLSPPGWAKTFAAAIENGRPEPYGKNSNFAYELMTVPLQQAQQLSLADQLPGDGAARREVLQKLLTQANARANEQMIGLIPPAEMSRRRYLAAAVLAAMVVAAVFTLRRVRRIFAPAAHGGGPADGLNRRRALWAYLLLLPAILTIVLWQYVPLGIGSVMAFQDYQLLTPSRWVGLDHFANLLVDGEWWQSVYNSLRLSALVIALTFLPPVALAILLQEIPVGKMAFRMIFYLPAVVTGLVVTLLWKQFYEPSESGMLNRLILHVPGGVYVFFGLLIIAFGAWTIRRLWYHEMKKATLGMLAATVFMLWGVWAMGQPIFLVKGESAVQAILHAPGRLLAFPAEPFRWLQDPGTAMLACVIPMVWAGVGPGCLIYLAALKGIPDDYYEAAEIDGATFLDKIIFIVVPILRPLLVIQFTGAFIGSIYGASANVLAMTGGGANTEVADLHIWYRAFTFLNFGSATAMAWMLGFLLIGFTVFQLRTLAKLEFKTAKSS